MNVRVAFLGSSVALGLFAVGGCAPPDGSQGDSATSETSDALTSGSAISNIALANVGHSACGANSQGGIGYASSCYGNGGQPEYWCADFARWVWGAAGVGDLGGLTAGAGSFFVYGLAHGTLSGTPHVGDAVVFNYQGGGYADHVAIVARVNGDGSIETVSGDWGGQSGSEAHFSSTSSVVLNAPAYPGLVNTVPGPIQMKISGFISPVGLTEAPAGAPAPQAPYYRAIAHDGSDNGYWIVGGDGGVFAFGGAPFDGSTGGKALAAPVVGMAATPSGNGYWLVASDGGLFSFGGAGFHGSIGGTHFNAPVDGMTPKPSCN